MSHPIWGQWRSQMKALDLKSPLDQKACDTAVAYFDLPTRGITNAAVALDLDRQTVTRRLERAHANEWVILGESPERARGATLGRVCRRRVFWTADFWSLLPQATGEVLAF